MSDAPVVHEFQIRKSNPWYGEFVTVEGGLWFVHAHEFKAYREWAEELIQSLRTEIVIAQGTNRALEEWIEGYRIRCRVALPPPP